MFRGRNGEGATGAGRGTTQALNPSGWKVEASAGGGLLAALTPQVALLGRDPSAGRSLPWVVWRWLFLIALQWAMWSKWPRGGLLRWNVGVYGFRYCPLRTALVPAEREASSWNSRPTRDEVSTSCRKG